MKELYETLEESRKKEFLRLQLLVIVMASFELLGVASIAPFMHIVSNMSIVENKGTLNDIYIWTGYSDPLDFITLLGFFLFLVLAAATLVSMVTTKRLAMFAAEVGTENADRLYEYYLHQGMIYHVNVSSSELIKKIANECTRVTDLVILPMILMNAKLVLVSSLIILIVIYDPFLALTSFGIFSILYIFIYILVKKRLLRNGENLSKVATIRYRLMNEGFGGIKDILLYNRQDYFTSKFLNSGIEFAKARGENHVLWQVPRFFVEFLAFGALIGLILYLIHNSNGQLSSILPTISLYSLAVVKILPSLQQIYASSSQIKGNLSAFQTIKDDLLKSKTFKLKISLEFITEKPIAFDNCIRLDCVSFRYPGAKRQALSDVSLTIGFKKTIGIVGASGSGKSTLIDVILGLLNPSSGKVLIDDLVINESNLKYWQGMIGYVPQSIYLTEGSIAENIAFGIAASEIDYVKVENAAKLAHLDSFVSDLELGLQTRIGERGVKLSGGQRQRIGIARALYNDPEILVFDEATSALDGVTESSIIEAINDFSGKKTIVMIAHRLKTIENCYEIYLMESGKIIANGSYEQLIKSNKTFKKMTAHG